MCQKRYVVKKEAGGKADTYTPGGAVNRASEFVELRLRSREESSWIELQLLLDGKALIDHRAAYI